MNESKPLVTLLMFVATSCMADDRGLPASTASDSASTTVQKTILSVTDNANVRKLAGRTYLDIEKGTFLPGQAREYPRLKDQLRRAGMDVFISVVGGSIRIEAVDMQLAEITASGDIKLDSTDITAAAATAALLKAKQKSKQEVPLGKLHYFRTTEGSIGALRVGAVTEAEPPARSVEYRILQPATWGKANNDLRVRLRPETSEWRQGENPALTLDIENIGPKSIHYLGIAPAECFLIIDEKMYGWSKPLIISAPGRVLAPGEKVDDAGKLCAIRDNLYTQWNAGRNSKPGRKRSQFNPDSLFSSADQHELLQIAVRSLELTATDFVGCLGLVVGLARKVHFANLAKGHLHNIVKELERLDQEDRNPQSSKKTRLRNDVFRLFESYVDFVRPFRAETTGIETSLHPILDDVEGILRSYVNQVEVEMFVGEDDDNKIEKNSQSVGSEATENVSIAELRRAISVFAGNMADKLIAERKKLTSLLKALSEPRAE